MSSVVRLNVKGKVAEIILANSARRNCINLQLAQELESAAHQAEKDACVILLRAEGPIFCAGIDLKAPPDDNRKAKAIIDRLLDETPLPWVARAEGGVIGLGISLAAACHVSIASESSWWWLPEIPKTGRMAWGVMDDLGDLVSATAVMGAMASAERLTAAQAYAAGMVSLVTGDLQLDAVIDRTLGHLTSLNDEARSELVEWWQARRRRRQPGAG